MTSGTQRSRSMLGSAVSSNTPTDFQPRPTMGFSELPLMNCQAFSPGPTIGCPYCAVGMHSAVDSAIGLPSSSTSLSRMLALVTPAEVSSSFKVSPREICDRQRAAPGRPSTLTTKVPIPIRHKGPDPPAAQPNDGALSWALE